MKNLLILFIAVPIVSFGQTNEKRIDEIRAWYEDIEGRLDKCVKMPITMFYDEDYVSGGSTETEGYFDTITNELIKIVEHTYYDWSEDQTSFYYHEGELFFVFQDGYTPGEMFSAEELGISEDDLWENGGEAKTLNHFENRYYFDAKECIRRLHKEAEIPIDQEDDLSGIKDSKLSTTEKAVYSLNNHGNKLYNQFMGQLKPKK